MKPKNTIQPSRKSSPAPLSERGARILRFKRLADLGCKFADEQTLEIASNFLELASASQPEQPSRRLRVRTEEAAGAHNELEQLVIFLDAARELWRTHRELVEQDEDPVPGIRTQAEEARKKFEALRDQWPDKGRTADTAH